MQIILDFITNNARCVYNLPDIHISKEFMRRLTQRLFYLFPFYLCMQFLTACSSSSSAGSCSLGSGSNITVSGRVSYDLVSHDASGALNFDDINVVPSIGVTVEAICNSVIASTATDVNGNYSLPIAAGSKDVFIRVKAELKKVGFAPVWNSTVVDNTRSQSLYAMTSIPFDASDINIADKNLHAASGWDTVTSAYNSTRVAAPFAIINSVYKAQQHILSMNENTIFPPLKINWSTANIAVEGNIAIGEITTTFYSNSQIYLLGEENGDTDEYDEHVIIHEWGHYFEQHFSRIDSIGGSHDGGDRLDIRVAFSEGFANAYSVIAGEGSVYFDSTGVDPATGFKINLENNFCGVNAGWYSECSIQSILYDLFDAQTDGADTAATSLGFRPIYNVMTGEQKDSVALNSIFSFIVPLRAPQDTSTSNAIDALVSSQNIDVITDIFGAFGTNDAINPAATATDVLDVYTNIAAGGGVSSLCVIDEFAEYIASDNEYYNENKLSSHRFLKFEPAATQSYTITVNKDSGQGDDPDIVLFHKGSRLASSLGTKTDTETLTASLTANETYIIQINDKEVTYATTKVGKTCFNVSMSN